MNRDIIAQLKELHSHPQAGWVDGVVANESRDRLMKAIGHHQDRVMADAHGSFVVWNFGHVVMRPVGAFVLILAFFFGGWFSTAKASANSLPGDALYGLKMVTEQAQLLITSQDNRAVLHTQFAQRRLSEVQALKDMGDERSSQYLVETVHALEAEVVKAGDALAQMKLNGDENVLMVASALDEKIGVITAELGAVTGQQEVVESAQQAVGEVAKSAVNTMVQTHEAQETQESAIALDRSFKNEYTSLRSRQAFDLGRVETIRSVLAANQLTGVVSADELLHIEFTIQDATDEVARAMDLAAAGGYRSAFEILGEADATLLGIEAQLVQIESAVMAAMNALQEDLDATISNEVRDPLEQTSPDVEVGESEPQAPQADDKIIE